MQKQNKLITPFAEINLIDNIESNTDSDFLNESSNPKDPSEYYTNYSIPKGDISNYEVHTKIGRGRYSEVFEGTNLQSQAPVVIKILKPIKKLKIKRETNILTYLKSCPNIIKLADVVKDKSTKTYCLVYASTQATEMKKMTRGISPEDLQFYMYKILLCLQYTHSKGIMHRDIKTGNIVINKETKELNVIDWGLAEYYVKGFEYNVRVASRYYKAPELLLNYKTYDYAIDMWSLGCLFAGVIFQRDYFFKGEDLSDQLYKIALVLGGEKVVEFLGKYKSYLKLSERVRVENLPKKEFSSFINDRNKYLVTEDALDLLDKLLQFDPEKRITANEALEHPYFKSLKGTITDK